MRDPFVLVCALSRETSPAAQRQSTAVNPFATPPPPLPQATLLGLFGATVLFLGVIFCLACMKPVRRISSPPLPERLFQPLLSEAESAGASACACELRRVVSIRISGALAEATAAFARNATPRP